VSWAARTWASKEKRANLIRSPKIILSNWGYKEGGWWQIVRGVIQSGLFGSEDWNSAR
jgi:hypothetical protein